MDKEWLKYYKYSKEQTAVLYETADWLIYRCIHCFSKQAQATHRETILRLVEDLVYTGGTEYAHAKVVGDKISYFGSKLKPTSISHLDEQVQAVRRTLAATVGISEWKKTRTLVHEFVGYVIAGNPYQTSLHYFLDSRYGKFVTDNLDWPDDEYLPKYECSVKYERMLDSVEVCQDFDWQHTKPGVEKHPILQLKDNVVDTLDVIPAEPLAETTQEPTCALSLYPTVCRHNRLVYKYVLRKRAIYSKDRPIGYPYQYPYHYQYQPSILPGTTLNNGCSSKPSLLQHSRFIGSPIIGSLLIGSQAFRPDTSLCRTLPHTDTLARKLCTSRYPNSPP